MCVVKLVVSVNNMMTIVLIVAHAFLYATSADIFVYLLGLYRWYLVKSGRNNKRKTRGWLQIKTRVLDKS